MKRLLFLIIFVLFITAFLQMFIRNRTLYLDFFLISPVMLVYLLLNFRFKQNLVFCLILGFIIDILYGTLAGINSFLMLSFCVFLTYYNFFAGKKSKMEIFNLIVVVSFFYRLVVIIFQLFLGLSVNMRFISLIFGPLLDAALGLVLFYALNLIFRSDLNHEV